MYISGWAFTENEETLRNSRFKRFKELNVDDLRFNSIRSAYTRKIYEGTLLNTNLSELDILLICDRGNTCFGGVVTKQGEHFIAEVYTD